MPDIDKPEILIITDLYWPSRGGVEESIRTLVEALKHKYAFRIATHATKTPTRGLAGRTAFQPTFAPYCDGAGTPVEPLVPSVAGRVALSGCLLWHAPLVRRLAARAVHDHLYVLYRLAFYRRFSQLIRHARLVHCFSTDYAAVLSAELCRLFGIPLIQNPPFHVGGWGDTARQLEAYGKADTLIVATRYLQGHMAARVPHMRAHLCVNPPHPAPPPPQPFACPQQIVSLQRPFVLFLGRRDSLKGLDLLLRAWKLIATDAVLVIAGPGERESYLPQGCLDIGHVTESEKHWLLSNCALFCLPSRSESFGMVYAEAMSHAKAVVGLDLVPINELILNTETGMLVQPDSPRHLAAALSHLLGDPKLCARMGANGKKRYELWYDHTRIAQRFAEAYDDLLMRQSQDH